jgi:hypothetical protein
MSQISDGSRMGWWWELPYSAVEQYAIKDAKPWFFDEIRSNDSSFSTGKDEN